MAGLALDALEFVDVLCQRDNRGARRLAVGRSDAQKGDTLAHPPAGNRRECALVAEKRTFDVDVESSLRRDSIPEHDSNRAGEFVGGVGNR